MTDEEKLRSRAQALHFLRKRTSGRACAVGPAARKVYRLSALYWILAVDLALQTCTGIGLEHYRVPDPPRELPWPTATLVIDQGSDGWAAVQFLLYLMNCCAVPISDFCHRTWHDTKRALSLSGLWPFVMLMTTAFNVSHGPWGGQQWHRECQDACEAWARDGLQLKSCYLLDFLC